MTILLLLHIIYKVIKNQYICILFSDNNLTKLHNEYI